ncbi:hypothetical protein [Alkalihalobacillus sp. BA299]|uniref:hypothetical protein n=1 Tax=Alkalihalobacillus sp. BA299 TaxID=2815938 RepID=UPI001ADD31FD|nr:hypothetical protein [Alkalihalobacillus sp. BA299]
MARIPNPVRTRKDGVEIVSNVDRAQFTIHELIRAANRAVGGHLRKRMMREARKMQGMKRNRRVGRAFQYWARRRETDLIIGSKHNTWYGAEQELGTRGQPKRAIIKDTVMAEVNEIRKIQGAFLSAIEDDNRARGLIDTEDEGKNDEND